ncbi:MAG: hypothetical protein WCJ49_05760, partial [Deltaproteobacteria bacterium]
MAEIFFSAIVGSLLCLDKTILQSIVSRPLVASLIIGVPQKELYVALIIGSLLEVLTAIHETTTDFKLFPNNTIVAVISVTLYTLLAKNSVLACEELIILTLFISFPMGIIINLFFKNIHTKVVALKQAPSNDGTIL